MRDFSLPSTFSVVLAVLAVPGLAAAQQRSSSPAYPAVAHAPLSITYPKGYRRALRRGTRLPSGQPGPRYWQQWTEYDLNARVDPMERRLYGSATIRYHNNSPDTLDLLYLFLNQNLHAPGVPKSRPQEITGGVTMASLSVAGMPLEEGVGYEIDGTVLTVKPPQPVLPGRVAAMALEWDFTIPQAGASSRMGWSEDNLLFLAYWYPQLAVYNDVVGWQNDPFTGTAEFYAGFGRYELTVEAPAGWLVVATGRLRDPESVLTPSIHERLKRAADSDEIVNVVTEADFRSGVTRQASGVVSWRFAADSVRDVAFSVTRESLWDAARAPVGDRDGDGSTEYTRVDAVYRLQAHRWKKAAGYARHAIAFLSRFTGVSYPWPHMTAVEGGGIIGGGMEFPMMTLIGDYNERSDTALYRVTAHELAHMWVPMIVNTDERRYAWMDEGTTRFNGHEATKARYPDLDPAFAARRGFVEYVEAARAEDEGEIMRWSDHHYTRDQYRLASYSKPETLLGMLRALLGEETFLRAYRTYLDSWAFKQPYPWDFFNVLETVSGQDLDWFWRGWYYETWTLDQAVLAVEPGPEGTRVVVGNLGKAAMPVRLEVERSDRRIERYELPVSVWLGGAREAGIVLPPGPGVTRVAIDPERVFPDIDEENNAWSRAGRGPVKGGGPGG